MVKPIELTVYLCSYELGGGAPCQLSLLHAAVAPLHAHYSVRILMASSLPHAARLIRRIIEETHKEAKVGLWPQITLICDTVPPSI